VRGRSGMRRPVGRLEHPGTGPQSRPRARSMRPRRRSPSHDPRPNPSAPIVRPDPGRSATTKRAVRNRWHARGVTLPPTLATTVSTEGVRLKSNRLQICSNNIARASATGVQLLKRIWRKLGSRYVLAPELRSPSTGADCWAARRVLPTSGRVRPEFDEGVAV